MSRSTIDHRDYELLFGADALRPGDAVVHFEHGLARYGGETTVDLGDETQVLTTFVYRNGGKLMLPAEEGRDFWPFGAPADDVLLDRLKTDDWVRRRDEMIAELKDAATCLMEEDRERRSQEARRLMPDAEKYAALAATFGHDETTDQARSIGAVLEDLGEDVPMDRLLVGDVGFGKTEVALRAAAAAALSGHQVVFAAPTTVLARQHVETMRDRFGALDIAVAEISRLTDPSERDDILRAMANGETKIVVGTQALLADDIAFRNLALLIIDEEQKFGREQKLGLRDLAPGLHVLRMTATPIPRSLAAAEVGLMDISVVATVPKGRKSVKTSIGALDLDRLRKGIAAEVGRGGQCYIVCPRIAGLDGIEDVLSQRDDVTYTVAHGQLSEDELETRMMRFMEGAVDVLLSTSIIESGLDNPRANTMIVWNADRFGLAQLHQLRGRIGRSDVQAHMILLADIEGSEESDAVDRLTAFTEMSEVGAGFRIAKKDRDIRGFGALEGTEQSGQMSRLGLGLYRHILREHLENG